MTLIPVRFSLESLMLKEAADHYSLTIGTICYGKKTLTVPKTEPFKRALLHINHCAFSSRSLSDSRPPYDALAFVNEDGDIRKVTSISGSNTHQIRRGVSFFSKEDMGRVYPFDINSYALCIAELVSRYHEIHLLLAKLEPELKFDQGPLRDSKERLQAAACGNRAFLMLETVMLQVRKACEMVYTMAITAHTHELGRSYPEYRIEVIKEHLDRINASYVPSPIVEQDNGLVIASNKEAISSQLSSYYKFACNWVHTTTPYYVSNTKLEVLDKALTFVKFLEGLMTRHAHFIGSQAVVINVPFVGPFRVHFERLDVSDGKLTVSAQPNLTLKLDVRRAAAPEETLPRQPAFQR